MRRVFARSVKVDHVGHVVEIDDIPLPWYLKVEPQVTALEGGILQMDLSILVDGVVTIICTDGGSKVIDPVLGDVGQYARNKVRAEFTNAFPWLRDV